MVRELGGRERLALHRGGGRRRQPGLLVRQRGLGPGRLVRRRLPAARRCGRCGATSRSGRRSSPSSRPSSSPSSGSSSRSSPSSRSGARCGRRGRGRPRGRRVAVMASRTGLAGWSRLDRPAPCGSSRPASPVRGGRRCASRSGCRSSACAAAVRPLRPLDQVAVAGGGYPYLTVNAYNAWALVPGRPRGQPGARRPVGLRRRRGRAADRCGAGIAQFGPVPAVAVGAALLFAGRSSRSCGSSGARPRTG